MEKSHHVQKNHEALSKFILPLEIADFDEKASQTYGIVRSPLEKDGKLIGSMDMLIGSHALSLGVTLITTNTREFVRINNLQIEDWTV